MRTALLYLLLLPSLMIGAGIACAILVGHAAVRRGRSRRWYAYGAVLAAAQ